MLRLQVTIEKRYVEILHTHPIAQFGFIYPKNVVVAKVADGLEVVEGGNECRIHTNGDIFAFDGTDWKRVFDINTVEFIANKI